MRKVAVVVCLLVSLVMLAGCAGKMSWEKNSTEIAKTSTAYGIRSTDGKILIETFSQSTITFNGLNLAPAHAAITELHNRLSTQSGFDVPEQLNADRAARDNSEKGSQLTFLIEITRNDLDNHMYVGFLPTSLDAKANLKYIMDNKYPKKAVLTTTCDGMSADECSRAIAKEALDIAWPFFEKTKAHFVK